MRLSSVYHWFFGLEQRQEEIIKRQIRLKYLLCKQIRESNLRLQPHQIPIPKKRKRTIIKCNK